MQEYHKSPLFERHVSEGVHPFKGSVMVVNDRNRQGLLDKIQSDVYIRDGVWNMHEAQVMPFWTLLQWQRVADGEY
jgi:acetyltransferase-like isoleucine patch superfamily enzyme